MELPLALLNSTEWTALRLSLQVALCSALFSLPIAIVAAYGLARFEFPGKWLLQVVVDLPLVLPPMPNGLRTFLDRQARQYGFKIQVELEVNNLATMMNVAASGEAFTLAPEIALGGPASAGPVGAWRLRNPGIRRSISLKLSTHHPLSNAARLVALRVRALTSELLSNRSARTSAASVEPVRTGAKAD